jgi:hypothetical protein
MDTAVISGRITEIALKCSGVDVIEEPKIGEDDRKNELLFFMKPEVFMLGSAAETEKLVKFILDSIGKYDARIDGICAVSGSALEKHNIMSSHYGYINVMSNSASTKTDGEAMAAITKAFGLEEGEFEVLGGHEYLKRFGDETPDTLDKVWFAEKSIKVRSGFYVRLIEKEGRKIVLVDGFHPNQLAYFTKQDRKIVLLLLHSDTEWSRLRNSLVGTTFPEKAAPESIRGMLYSHAAEYGFEKVDISNNCVHLSAGPFEAMSEILNFFGKLIGMDIGKVQPNMLKRMMASGITYDDAVKALDNPRFSYQGKDTDLFGATEDKDTDDAIGIYSREVLKR